MGGKDSRWKLLILPQKPFLAFRTEIFCSSDEKLPRLSKRVCVIFVPVTASLLNGLSAREGRQPGLHPQRLAKVRLDD